MREFKDISAIEFDTDFDNRANAETFWSLVGVDNGIVYRKSKVITKSML